MTSYATEAELYVYGAPQKAFGQLTNGQILGALESASRDVDTYLRGRFSLPLSAWDSSITESTCRIAAYNLLSIRGYNPASGSDVNVKDRYDQTMSWLNKVQKQQAHPNVTPAQIDTPDYNQPVVISSSVVDLSTGLRRTNRGW
jgi:phage gp36-like protein